MRQELICAFVSMLIVGLPVAAATQSAAQSPETPALRGPVVNSVDVPSQILRTGVSLTAEAVSPNSWQLANSIGLAAELERIQKARTRVEAAGSEVTLESLAAKQELLGAVQKAELLITHTSLDVDFTIAEIEAEGEVYQEMLGKFTSDRDKLLARVNAGSFISNGVLWTICEALSIASINTTFMNNPRHLVQFPIPSGIVGIAAGIVPSLASMYTLKAVNGKKKTSEADPNMLAKLFGYPVTADNEYPASVWNYLHQTPADQPNGKIRLDQMVDRWVSDSNIPDFTDRASKKQLDVLTACVVQKKGLTIATLSTRLVMLNQLEAEVWKMKRMLLELTMAIQGEKSIS
jgi:hypothetical protein